MDIKTIEIQVGRRDRSSKHSEMLYVNIPEKTPPDKVAAEAKRTFEKMVSGWAAPYFFQKVKRVMKSPMMEDESIDQGGW
jgi:hypothetical protein